MSRLLLLGLLVVTVASCQVPPERTPLRPLPEQTIALPYAELLTRARAQATNATAAFYVNKWDDLEDAARGLEQTARFLPKAQEVPAKHKDSLAALSGDLGKDALKLLEAAKGHNVKETTDYLQRVNLKVRELRLDCFGAPAQLKTSAFSAIPAFKCSCILEPGEPMKHSLSLDAFRIDRRALLTSAVAIAAGGLLTARSSAAPRDYSSKSPVRYPDPDIISLDKRFDKYKIGNTPIKRLHTGMLWAEGPAWNAAGRYLVWSDIPNNVQMRWLNEDGHVSVFRNPSHFSNGNTFDFEGRQISFEHGKRRVVRYDFNGGLTVLADKFQGKPLNAPNDGAVHRDGGIWFTDPGYGILLDYEGHKNELQLKEAVYRIDPKSGKIEKMTDEPFKPNGLCFSPDYKKVYIAETGATHYKEAPKNIWVYDVIDGKRLGKQNEFCSMTMTLKRNAPGGASEQGGAAATVDQKVAGLADGIRADTDGNIWVGAGWVGEGYDGVQVFAPDGTRIGQILLPEICANVCFGGPRRNRLFMCASQSLYAVYVEAQGAHNC